MLLHEKYTSGRVTFPGGFSSPNILVTCSKDQCNHHNIQVKVLLQTKVSKEGSDITGSHT